MTQQGYGWHKNVLVVLLGAALFAPLHAWAEEETKLGAATKKELLMFWEEKELYVQTATRSEKPLTEVGENMTIITAEKIEAMNANSVAEVLARAPGLFVDFGTNEYASSAQFYIQGSESRHVTVLLDGMPVNFLSGGNAETSFIPLRIVDRIEVIKGAASSTWGSAMGGVINIITRRTGDYAAPNGMLSASIGEGNSRDLAAELRGRSGPVGYYFYTGQQASDGLLNNRDFRRTSAFAKLFLMPNHDLDITLSAGYSNPEENYGEIPLASIRAKSLSQNRFLNSSFESRINPRWTLRGGLHLFNSHFDQPIYFLPTFAQSPGQLRRRFIADDQTIGANMLATCEAYIHNLTMGIEASHGRMGQTTNNGPFLQGTGNPAINTTNSTVDKWGIFANDTLLLLPLTITPGIRLDHDSGTGYFVSPSLGFTWELGEHSVARAAVARGFTSAPLGYRAGLLNFNSNNQLKPEYGWSYQIGLESEVAKRFNVKATLFRHDTTNAIIQVPATATTLSSFTNQGDVTRQGYELEVETLPFHFVSLKLGHAYAHVKADTQQSGFANSYYDNYSWLVGIKYDDRYSFNAQLTGSYTWWDYSTDPPPRYSTFIWDLTATKKFRLSRKSRLETFLTIHNIFSGDHYSIGIYPNPHRWVEGGLRFIF